MCFLAVLIVLKDLGLSLDSLFLCDEPSRRERRGVGKGGGGVCSRINPASLHTCPLKALHQPQGLHVRCKQGTMTGDFFKMENVVSG